MSRYIYSRIFRKKVLAALITLFILCTGLYAYFLQQTVQSVVERKQLDTEIASLHSRIGDAEYNYGSSVSQITLDKALAMGFQPVEDTTYVTRAHRGTLVTINVPRE